MWFESAELLHDFFLELIMKGKTLSCSELSWWLRFKGINSCRELFLTLCSVFNFIFFTPTPSKQVFNFCVMFLLVLNMFVYLKRCPFLYLAGQRRLTGAFHLKKLRISSMLLWVVLPKIPNSGRISEACLFWCSLFLTLSNAKLVASQRKKRKY